VKGVRVRHHDDHFLRDAGGDVAVGTVRQRRQTSVERVVAAAVAVQQVDDRVAPRLVLGIARRQIDGDIAIRRIAFEVALKRLAMDLDVLDGVSARRRLRASRLTPI